MHRIGVYCGSSGGKDPKYRRAAAEFGHLLVERGYSLVFGGGKVGIMGAIADAVLEAGGEVIGVIPEFLATKELIHPGVPDMRRVADMHTRKALMAALSDAFVALPGGLGTLDELFETLTWSQLGLHAKPVGLLNVDGYFNALIEFVDRSVATGFCLPDHRNLFFSEPDATSLLDRLPHVHPPRQPKWLTPDEL
jgi:uncharacterized protein (TIGR00730 family)